MAFASRVAKVYEDFKREHDRYPVKIAISNEGYAMLSEEVRKTDSRDFNYRPMPPSLDYKTVPIVKDSGITGQNVVPS